MSVKEFLKSVTLLFSFGSPCVISVIFVNEHKNENCQ